MVWLKRRNGSSYGAIVDVVRGDDQFIQSYDNDQDATDANIMDLESDGYTLKSTLSTHTYVGWAWNAGASQAATGTWGANSKAYTRWTNATAGISIIKWVGDASTGIPGTGAIPHGLSGTPDILIQKRLDSSGNWWTGFDIYDGSWDYMKLDDATAKGNESYALWDADEISNWGAGTNHDFMAYVFKSIPGFSQVGKYVGNNANSGRFVNCGFGPRYLMIKRIDSTGSWAINDIVRDTNTLYGNDASIYADTDGQETTSSSLNVDILSNGFKLRSNNADYNGTGTYLYIAFAAKPFKYTTAY